MLNPVTFIQNNILRNASAVVTAKLTELLSGVLEEVYNYHDWRCVTESEDLALVAGTAEYDLSGANNDLQKIINIYYGDYLLPLPDYSEKEFRRSIYGRVDSSEPVCYVVRKKINEYTWKVLIHPIDEVTSDPTPYYTYKKRTSLNLDDVAFYSNQMVFVNGILSLYFLGQVSMHPDNATLPILAREYLFKYRDGLEKMKQEDEAIVHPTRKMVISDKRKRNIRRMRIMSSSIGR